MPLYFAYGSNLDAAAMRARCPASRPLGIARLMGYRFFLMSTGYASVTRDPTRIVYGLLWDLAQRDVAALDRYEGVADGLYVKRLLPVVAAVGSRRALVYVGRSTMPGAAHPGYMEAILLAAESAELPASYRQQLSRFSEIDGNVRASPRASTLNRRAPR
jgi:gamma-glutamylcyclotransferase (GGCT)/AIG2-like uncharacterized protein YtfP